MQEVSTILSLNKVLQDGLAESVGMATQLRSVIMEDSYVSTVGATIGLDTRAVVSK